MKIAVFGTGVVGQVIAEKMLSLGHSVMIGTRNVNETLAKVSKDNFGRAGFGEWYKKQHGLQIGTYADAARFAELIVNATSGHGSIPALEAAGKDNLKAKVLIDIANPLDFSKGMPPTLFVCNTDSLAEQIQRSLPDTHVVKTLNTMTAYVMVNPSLVPGPHNVFMSGNNAAAKTKVGELLQSFGWNKDVIIDLGDISTARGTEQLLPVWIRLWGALQNPIFNFHIATGKA